MNRKCLKNKTILKTKNISIKTQNIVLNKFKLK